MAVYSSGVWSLESHGMGAQSYLTFGPTCARHSVLGPLPPPDGPLTWAPMIGPDLAQAVEMVSKVSSCGVFVPLAEACLGLIANSCDHQGCPGENRTNVTAWFPGMQFPEE